MTWAEFCRAPGRALSEAKAQGKVVIAAGRIELALTRLDPGEQRPCALVVGVTELHDNVDDARGRVRAVIGRGERVGIKRFEWPEAMIERVT